uniref:Uncharacterized protein n=1 Tax=Arundo donax TaxID=35708 RepID=A0A0A9F9F5_ARUDO
MEIQHVNLLWRTLEMSCLSHSLQGILIFVVMIWIIHQDLLNLKMIYGLQFPRFPCSHGQLVLHHLPDCHLFLNKNHWEKMQMERRMSVFVGLVKSTIIIQIYRSKQMFLQ